MGEDELKYPAINLILSGCKRKTTKKKKKEK